VPVAHERTIYSQWGDWFAWVCVLTLLLIRFVR
jgi:apolipoprotein N-acyltransferase